MKPVAIFRHTSTEGPGYFATFLDKHSIPWQLIAVDRGEAIPNTPEAFSGICLMGGTISVNDPLPWIEQSCQLIRAAVAGNIPVIGHCLGGQLMSKALGGRVTRNPVKEIGWGMTQPESNEEANRWFGSSLGAGQSATVFHWHGETFSLPPGATRILSGTCCANQMFVTGLHLAMQCHVEMTEAMIDMWSKTWAKETQGLPALHPNIQTPEAMRRETPERMPAMRRVAEQLYSVWIGGLRRN